MPPPELPPVLGDTPLWAATKQQGFPVIVGRAQKGFYLIYLKYECSVYLFLGIAGKYSIINAKLLVS